MPEEAVSLAGQQMKSGTKLTKAIAVWPSVQAWMPRREENASRLTTTADVAQEGTT